MRRNCRVAGHIRWRFPGRAVNTRSANDRRIPSGDPALWRQRCDQGKASSCGRIRPFS